MMHEWSTVLIIWTKRSFVRHTFTYILKIHYFRDVVMYSAGNVCKVPQGNYKVRSVWQWLSHQMINRFLIKFIWLKFYVYNFMTYCGFIKIHWIPVFRDLVDELIHEWNASLNFKSSIVLTASLSMNLLILKTDFH